MVDSSVWIDFFRDRPEPHVTELARLIADDAGVALTDIVLTELLQGVRGEAEAMRVDERLSAFDVLRLHDLADFRRASWLYRRVRAHGHTIRWTLDCLIASVCVREGVPLLHHDADFDRLAACTALRVHRVTAADGGLGPDGS